MRFERKKFRSRIESEPIARLSKTHHNYRGAPFAREEYEAASQSLFLSLSLSLAVSGISIYGHGLPGPTSYDIVSAGSRNLRDR